MAEVTIKVDVPKEFKDEFEAALAEAVKQFVQNLNLSTLRKRLESKEESELIRWSVELGRKAKKESFKNSPSEISAEEK